MLLAAVGGAPVAAYAGQSPSRRTLVGGLQPRTRKPKENADEHASKQCRGVFSSRLRALAVASETSMAAEAHADLSDMCTLQLGMLYQLLARAGSSYSSMRCAVYARSLADAGPGQVKLTRVAHFPIDPGQGEGPRVPQQNTLLLHTEQSWALQGGSASPSAASPSASASAAADPSALIDDCLLHREVVALPSSSALVFPLVDCAVLVGLLVVELEQEADLEAARPDLGPNLEGLREGAAAAGAGTGLTGAASVAALLPALCSCDAGGVSAAAEEHGCGGGADGACEGGLGPEGWMGRGRLRRSLTDEELRCLRLAVPLLSKACGMDARAALSARQSSVAAAAARGLLAEAARPLSTLNTLSTMLVPRLKEGEPDKDLAKGVLMQGKRLQDLLWQLEDALHGPPAAGHGALAPAPDTAAAPGLPRPMGLRLPAEPRAHAPAGPALPFRSPSALPSDPSPAVQELLQLPQPRAAALPAGPQDQLGPVVSGSTAGAGAAASQGGGAGAPAVKPDGGGTGPPPVLPGLVTFVDRAAAEAVSSSAFTIRQPQGFSAGRGRPGGGSVHPAVQPGAAMATIDVETERCESRPVGHPGSPGATGRVPVAGRVVTSAVPTVSARGGANGGSGGGGAVLGWGPGRVTGPVGGAAAAAVTSTNLVSALAGVLIAAAKLAAVSGIGFIASSPLSSVLPRRGSPGRKTPPGAAAESPAVAGTTHLGAADDRRDSAASSSDDGDGGAGEVAAVAAAAATKPAAPRLIPRPLRPLLVGVRTALVQRVVGYILDIALQATPRGGQVCVSARQDGAGVQVQVLHSGRMDPRRPHARSHGRAALPSVLSLSAAAGAAAAASAAVTATSAAAQTAQGLNGGAPVAAALATRAAAAPAAVGGGLQPGSAVLSVEMAQELAQQAGGHLTVSYPFNMVNAQSGSLDVGTSVEIWLPGPGVAGL